MKYKTCRNALSILHIYYIKAGNGKVTVLITMLKYTIYLTQNFRARRNG